YAPDRGSRCIYGDKLSRPPVAVQSGAPFFGLLMFVDQRCASREDGWERQKEAPNRGPIFMSYDAGECSNQSAEQKPNREFGRAQPRAPLRTTLQNSLA